MALDRYRSGTAQPTRVLDYLRGLYVRSPDELGSGMVDQTRGASSLCCQYLNEPHDMLTGSLLRGP